MPLVPMKVILDAAEKYNYAQGAFNVNAVKKYGESSPIPIALHLDHGKTPESCVAAIAGGYTSVMTDGSSLPFDKNVELTWEVVKYAHERGSP